MTHIEEFSLIAEQLAWLEQHVRNQSSAVESDRIAEALKALVCARAVIEQLAQISTLIDPPAVASPA